jgi:hypothetical protein
VQLWNEHREDISCTRTDTISLLLQHVSVELVDLDHHLGVGVVVVLVGMAVVAVVRVTVVLVVVVDVALIVSVNIIMSVTIVAVVVVRLGVAVVVVVVVVVRDVRELLGELVDEALIDSLLEFDLVLVVFESMNHRVIEMILDLEPQDFVLQLVLELLDSLSAKRLVVAVMTVVVAVVSVVVTVVPVVVTVMTVVLVVVVGMRMLVVVGMDMDGSVRVDLLSGDRGDGDVGRVLLVVVNNNVTRGVVTIPLGNIVTVRINPGVSGDGLGQGGGETEKGNGDDGGLHI